MAEALFCPSCGSQLTAGSPAGLCSRCLMKRGMQSPTAGFTETATQSSRWEPPAVGDLADQFAELEILELLGRGGMGAVYKARQKQLGRTVALKILPPDIGRDPAFAERFTREAKALARLNHPGIVTLYEFGRTTSGLYYFLMEYVDGTHLRHLMQNSRLSPREAMAIVPQVCDALQYAHDQGIVHRDIKPENILLDRRGRVKVADFGLAKITGHEEPASDALIGGASVLTTDGRTMGTPQYMAPEQKAHAVTDHRADIYSLGVVFYELLTGELPADKLQPPSRKVQIDVRLDEIVLRALETKPELRYQTAGEFRTQVETMTSGANLPPTKPGAAAVASRFSRAAVVGACWAPFFLVVLVWLFTAGVKTVSSGEYQDPPRWLAVLAIALGGIGITAPFGTTILGWVSVTQIRRSAGKLYGLGLAVFDGLLFPLLALDGVFVWGVTRLIQIFIEFYSNFSNPGNPQVHPPLTTRLANLFSQRPELATLIAVSVVVVVDFFIIRAVWRAVNKPLQSHPTGGNASSPVAVSNSTLSHVAYGCAWLSGILAAITWSIILFAPPRLPELLSWSILIAALAAMALSIPVRKSPHGKWALRFGSIQTIVWIVFVVFALFTAQLSPTQARAEIEHALKQEITAQLSKRSERFINLNVTISPDGGAAAVDIVGLQELRGDTGKAGNVGRWVDINGILSAKNENGDWIVQGDGALGAVKFTVPLADLTRAASVQPLPSLSWIFGPVTERAVNDPHEFDDAKSLLLDTADWETMPAAELAARMAAIGKLDIRSNGNTKPYVDLSVALAAWIAEGKPATPLPPSLTWGFTKPNGGAGILQITGFTENPRGVKLRYKLVQSANSTAALPNKPVWGEPTNGMSISLQADQVVWHSDETPVLRASLRNDGEMILSTGRTGNYLQQVEVGGKWYRARLNYYGSQGSNGKESFTTGGVLMNEIKPGERWDHVQISLHETDWQRATPKDLELTTYPFNNGGVVENEIAPVMSLSLGKHTVRVAFVVEPARAGSGKSAFRVISNPVELEIQNTAKPPATAPSGTATSPAFVPVMERVLPNGAPCMEQYFQFRSGDIFIAGNGPSSTAEEAEQDLKKAEAAGGVDITAGSGEGGIQLVGHGCIFAEDVQGLQWDTFTAEEVVNAMNRVSFSFGVVEPKAKDLPKTYLFKTSRDEVGILEILGVVEDERAVHDPAFKGHGMKFRYKLVQSGAAKTAAVVKPAGIDATSAFGPVSNGLQAAVDISPG